MYTERMDNEYMNPTSPSAMELIYKFHDELLSATAPNTDELCKQKKRVRFASADEESSSACSDNEKDIPHPLSRLVSDDENGSCDWEEACKTLWYSSEELKRFKTDARSFLLNHEHMTEDDLRGLERYHYERAQWKRQSNRYIVDAFKEANGNATFLSMVCQKYTLWARDIAIDQASRDEYLAKLVHDNIDHEPVYPYGNANDKKRSIECREEMETGRRVRQRLGQKQPQAVVAGH